MILVFVLFSSKQILKKTFKIKREVECLFKCNFHQLFVNVPHLFLMVVYSKDNKGRLKMVDMIYD